MQSAGFSANSNIFSVARYIVANEGIFALYRGLIPPLLSLSALNTINFTSYSYFRNDVLAASRGWDIRNGIAGMACGPLASSISTIENLIKVRKPQFSPWLQN
jgi:solute carrier family 25 carnitine/acylcarnitine transporter 20/29